MGHLTNVSKTKRPAPASLPLPKKKAISDRRLKCNVAALRDALATLLQLRGVVFQYNSAGRERGCPAGPQIGMIAQEVEKVVPQWVQVTDDGYRELAIQGFEGLAVEALRELKAENDALRAEMAEVKNLLRALQEEIRPIYSSV